MAKFLKCFILGLFCVFSLTSFADAQDPQTLMVTIYGGLADIIEANMNNPGQCIAEIESFCQRHRADIDKLTAISQSRQLKPPQDYSPEEVSTKRLEQTLEAMAQSTGFQETNRFMQAVQDFSMQNLDYAEELGDAIEKGFPQPVEDY